MDSEDVAAVPRQPCSVSTGPTRQLGTSTILPLALAPITVRSELRILNRFVPNRRHTPYMAYVLVVDDDASIRKFLRRRLEMWGYEVREATNATEALEVMLSEPATIALIDIRMPGRDGLWLAEQIRQRWSKTAIIIATGADDVGSIEKSRAVGAVDYVLKPFDHELLRQALVRAATRLVE